MRGTADGPPSAVATGQTQFALPRVGMAVRARGLTDPACRAPARALARGLAQSTDHGSNRVERQLEHVMEHEGEPLRS
jgi:hypothetical protein